MKYQFWTKMNDQPAEKPQATNDWTLEVEFDESDKKVVADAFLRAKWIDDHKAGEWRITQEAEFRIGVL